QPVDDARTAGSERDTYAECLGLVEQPDAEALGRQPVPPLEDPAAVERDRDADDLVQNGQQEHVDEDRQRSEPSPRPEASGRSFGGIPQRQRPAAPDEAGKEHRAPHERYDRDSTLQP